MAVWNPKTKKWEEEEKVWNPQTKQWESTVVDTEYSDKYWNPRTKQWEGTNGTVQEEKKKDDSLQFVKKSGNWDDGYQFGDVLDATLSTVAHAGTGVVKGFVGSVEGITDWLSYRTADVADFVGADSVADFFREDAKANFTENTIGKAEDYFEESSVLGRTSESTANAIGNVASLILPGKLLKAAGWGKKAISAYTTAQTFLSSSGGGQSEAYAEKEDISDIDAATYGTIKGAVDAGTELMFGGLGKAVGATGLSTGLLSIDETLAQALSSKITNVAAKNLLQFGIKAGAEGFEEVAAGFVTALAKKFTYMEEEDLLQLIDDQNLLEQFVVGTLTSGLAQSGYVPGMTEGSLREANKTGRDFITGYTKNEQSLVDTLVENRIKEEESGNKKLTTREKNEIKKEITTMLERGEIDTDLIESTFASDTYNAHNSLVEEAEEFNTLYKTESGKLSEEQKDRLAELKAKNTEKSYIDRLYESQQKLSEEVGKATENDMFIQSSLAEKSKRSEVYKVDESKKYSEKELETINKAVEYGQLNNTRKTHEFVDLVAKLSADKGVSFDFTNNKKLADSKMVVEGKTINGFKKGSNITVNMQSKKALNSVVGHEITHVLEGTELYSALESAVEQYAKTKGVYDSIFNTASDNYRNVYTGLTEEQYKAKIKQEVTADLVGDYIFTDIDFVRNLSTKNRNLFEKIYDEIKYLVKSATAGSKEARELLKAKKIFEEVYKDSNINTSEEVRHSLYDSFEQEVDAWYKDKSAYEKSGGFFKVGRTSEALKSVGVKEQEITFDKNKIKKILNDHPEMTIEIIKNVPYAIENPILIMQSKTALDSVTVYGEVYATVNGKEQPVMVAMDLKPKTKGGRELGVQKISSAYVRTDDNGNKATEKAQSLVNTSEILYIDPNKKRTDSWLRAWGLQLPDGLTTYGSIGKVTYSDDFVNNELESFGNSAMADAFAKAGINTSDGKPQFSLSTDSEGRQLSTEQKEYFKDSKVVNDNGELIIVYHGTRNADFTVFKRNHIFFTDNIEMADSYAPTGDKFAGYLNLKNPFVIDAQGEKWSGIPIDEETKTLLENYGSSVFKEKGQWRTSTADIVSAIEDGVDDGSFNYDGVIIKNVDDTGSYHKGKNNVVGNDYIAFNSNQFKSLENKTPTDNPDINMSLSDNNQAIAPLKGWTVTAEDVALETAPTIEETVQEETVEEVTQYAPMTEEEALEMDNETEWDRLMSAQESDMAPEMETPIYSDDTSRLSKSDMLKVRNEVRNKLPLQRGRTQEFNDIVQKYAVSEFPNRQALADDIMEKFGTVSVTEEIADVVEVQKLLRQTRLNVSEHIKNSVSDYNHLMRRNFGKIRFSKEGLDVDVIYSELSERYPHFFPEDITNEIDQFEQMVEVANMVRTETGEFAIDEETLNDAVNTIMRSVRDIKQDHVQKLAERGSRWFDKDALLEEYMQTDDYQNLVGNPNLVKVFHKRWNNNDLVKEKPEAQTAKILSEEPVVPKKGFKENLKRKWAVFKANYIDKGAVFEDLAKTTKNRQLEAKWDYIMLSEAQAQQFMRNGWEQVKSLDAIREEVENSGYKQEFSEYMYHKLNIDRMTLDARYGIENKAVFGNTVTADVSKQLVAEMEKSHPEFKRYADDVYSYLNALREQMVDKGVISKETADLWSEMYPHYVPIRRVGSEGVNINVPLATNRTSVNAPIKKAVGGSTDILPLFDTLGQRTMQTFKAINKNDFGIELKNTLASVITNETQSVDNAVDMVETQEDLLQAGKNGHNPTFTVFEDGKRITFEITQEMYEALSPVSQKMRDSGSKALQKVSSFHRGVLTEYNPVFALTNGIKDAQDILINSQHPLKTYAKILEATHQLIRKDGYWYKEYMRNGGVDNSYFDTETNTFAPIKKGILDAFPLKAISDLNNFIERIPRLAEYIVSREMGRSVQESMLDSARVTTNFKAGGDVTKFLNRNGVTFLNASVQGATQQVRNVREANMNGWKGWLKLATKFTIAGLPALLLNNLLWDDDEEYEELSDYVKQNYYVIAKYGDGHFVRIPKGRTVAVIQEAVNQMQNLITGDDEADLMTFAKLAATNLAPNNPIQNNVLAPVAQVIANKTWYKEDLVPQRLQSLPAREQYDESTDELSKILGDVLNFSPMKINYLLDQYTGLVGDMILPALTPEVKSGGSGIGDAIIAPLKDKFTTDGVMNKQVITDFYSKSEELTTNAKKSSATDLDIIKNKYLNSIKAEMNELYAQKREIQNMDIPNDVKYEQVREVQMQITELAKEGMANYESATVGTNYASVGDKHYRLNNDGEWQKITGEQLEKQNAVTSKLNISANAYWSNKEEYDFAYEKPGKYVAAQIVGGYDTFNAYNEIFNNIESDKDKNGNSINGSKKTKVANYINGLPLSYGQKIILFTSQYPKDDTYKGEILDYLNSKEDITYEEIVDILTELEYKVYSDGRVTW